MATKKKTAPKTEPKKRVDKKAVRLVEKTLKVLDKFIAQASIGEKPRSPSIRVAHGKEVRELLTSMLKGEKDGWFDIPSKKERKAAKKATKKRR